MSSRTIVNIHPDKAPRVDVTKLTYSYSVHIGGLTEYTVVFLRTKADLINFKNNFNQAYDALIRKENNGR